MVIISDRDSHFFWFLAVVVVVLFLCTKFARHLFPNLWLGGQTYDRAAKWWWQVCMSCELECEKYNSVLTQFTLSWITVGCTKVETHTGITNVSINITQQLHWWTKAVIIIKILLLSFNNIWFVCYAQSLKTVRVIHSQTLSQTVVKKLPTVAKHRQTVTFR